MSKLTLAFLSLSILVAISSCSRSLLTRGKPESPVVASVIAAGAVAPTSTPARQQSPTTTLIPAPSSLPSPLSVTLTPLPTNTPESTPTPGPRFFGIHQVPSSDFPQAVNLGISSVGIPHQSASGLQSALEIASSLELNLLGRAEGRKSFQSGKKIDFVKLERIISAVFASNDIARHPNFFGYYIIDEPCHPGKWDISLVEFERFYQTVKRVDPHIPVLVNFGDSRCLGGFVPSDCSGWPIVDIAVITITPKKNSQYPDFLQNANSVAAQAKSCHPDLQVVIQVAVYEYPGHWPMPPADWVRQVGMEILSYDHLDGVIYWPWNPSPYMARSVRDVADDPDYIRAFNDVFDAARAKLGS